MKMGMNVNVMSMVDVINPHPKDLSKSPAVAGFFVCGMLCKFGYEKTLNKDIEYE